MARIRSIKPEFWTSEQIAECSPNARLLFIGMWNFCDDYGVIPASEMRLKMSVFPADPFGKAEIRAMICELAQSNLIEEYTAADNHKYWHVTGWNRHQKPDCKTGLYPLPTGELGRKIRRTFGERTPNEQRTDGDHSRKEKEKEKEKEKKKEKEKEKEKEESTTTDLNIATEQTAMMTINELRFVFSDSFGIPMPGGCNELAHQLCREFTADKIRQAVSISANQGKTTLAYVEGVLRGNGKRATLLHNMTERDNILAANAESCRQFAGGG